MYKIYIDIRFFPYFYLDLGPGEVTHSQNPGARQDTAAVPGKPLTGALRDDFISSTCAGGFFKTTTKCPRFIREEEMDGGWVERDFFLF